MKRIYIPNTVCFILLALCFFGSAFCSFRALASFCYPGLSSNPRTVQLVPLFALVSCSPCTILYIFVWRAWFPPCPLFCSPGKETVFAVLVFVHLLSGGRFSFSKFSALSFYHAGPDTTLNWTWLLMGNPDLRCYLIIYTTGPKEE